MRGRVSKGNREGGAADCTFALGAGGSFFATVRGRVGVRGARAAADTSYMAWMVDGPLIVSFCLFRSLTVAVEGCRSVVCD